MFIEFLADKTDLNRSNEELNLDAAGPSKLQHNRIMLLTKNKGLYIIIIIVVIIIIIINNK